MSLDRRFFLKTLGVSGSVLSGITNDHILRIRDSHGSIDWAEVRALFPISQWEKIHFNSGSAGVMPTPVQEHLFDLIRHMNGVAPYEAWSQWQKIRKSNISRLAAMIQADPEELTIVRNTTEALNMIIYGLPLTPDDEIIYSNNIYPFAKNAWDNRAVRESFKSKEVSYTLPMSDDEIVSVYRQAITPATKYIHITHMTHREGHIMPIGQIADLAAEHNIELIIDGAHAIGQIDVSVAHEAICYYASSLHKWLNAPHGSGLLYVQKDKIKTLQNHPSSYPQMQSSIDKYEHIGTRAFHQEIGISAALDFHEDIGFTNKKARLQELKHYWTNQMKDIPGVTFHTDLSDDKSCAITTLSLDSMSGHVLAKRLDQEYDIHAKVVGSTWGQGIRISVNIFTSFAELDRLAQALTALATE